jgi:hypothetical protein
MRRVWRRLRLGLWSLKLFLNLWSVFVGVRGLFVELFFYLWSLFVGVRSLVELVFFYLRGIAQLRNAQLFLVIIVVVGRFWIMRCLWGLRRFVQHFDVRSIIVIVGLFRILWGYGTTTTTTTPHSKWVRCRLWCRLRGQQCHFFGWMWCGLRGQQCHFFERLRSQMWC